MDALFLCMFCGNDPVNNVDPTGFASFARADGGAHFGGGDGFSINSEQGVWFNSKVNTITAGPASVPQAKCYGLYDAAFDAAVLTILVLGPEAAGTGGGVALSSKAVSRFFYDSRKFKSISSAYWKTRGGAGKMSLHHWFFPQRASAYGVSEGVINGGYNMVVIPRSVNSWMGYSKTTGWVAENAIRIGIPTAVAGSIVAGGKVGMYYANNYNSWAMTPEPCP